MPTDPISLAPGSILAGRYRIDGQLGQGGMGVVFRAHDRVLDEAVAVKVLRPERANDMLRRRFRAEIKLARRIRHPNVCAIHEYGEEAGLAYIAMEAVDGEDLRQVLTRRGRLAPREAAGLGRQIAAGLTAIHEAGVVHRDLKPANAMVDATGRLRLMDFGIAKALDGAAAQHTAIGQVVGTPEYMSPEQASGHQLDARSDLYALGVVLFELLTGRVPFRGNTPVVTLMQHVSQAVPTADLATLPAELRDLVARLLSKRPADRPGSAAEVAAELGSVEAGLSADVVEEPPQQAAELPTKPVVIASERQPREAAPPAAPERQPAAPERQPAAAERQPLQAVTTATVRRAQETVMTPTVRRALPVAVDPVAADPGWERTLRDERRPARDWDDLELAPSVPLEEVPPAPLPPTRSVWVPLALLGAAVFVLGFVGLLALGLPRTGTQAQPTRLPDPDPVPIAVRETPGPVAPPTTTASVTQTAAPLAATPLPPPATLPTAPPTVPIAREPSSLPAEPRTALSTPSRPGRVAPGETPTTQPADEGPGFGILRIELEPAAEISIDGQPVGTHARHDALLEQGTHTVTLHFPGRTPFDRKVELRAGESVRLALQLDVAAP